MKIKYAVVGLGHIAQVAVLPAFTNAKKNSELVALVSGTLLKLKKLSKKYKVKYTFSYEEYDDLLDSGLIDAVYICLPNDMHHEYTMKALSKGIHVLCEKPLCISNKTAQTMIEASLKNKAKLMTAYRLHFEPANLKAIEIAKSGKLGDLRYFNSSFSYYIQDKNNIRLKNKNYGGPIWDIGIYCINAARYIFQSEPTEVIAMSATNNSKLFSEVEEMVSVILRFPENRIASFVCSFGAYEASTYSVYGTKGSLTLSKAYEYASERKLEYNSERTSKKVINYKKADQFSPEIIYFSDRIINNKKIEPSGQEGLADIKVIEAIYESLKTDKAISIAKDSKIETKMRPTLQQKIRRPGVPKVEPILAPTPSGD